ncbi:MAG: DUF4173 domain-containing protein [Actinomycetota bacterium]
MTDLALPPPSPTSPVAAAPTPRWHPRRPQLATIAVAIAWAVGVFGTPFRSLGVAIAATVLVVAAGWSFAPTRTGRWLAIAGATFVPWLAIRHSPWLIWVDVVVASLLLLTGLMLRPRASSPPATECVRGHDDTDPTVHAPSGPEVLLRSSLRRLDNGGRLQRLVPFIRPMLIALGLTVVVLVVLASGDAVFASYFGLSVVGPISVRLAAAVAGVVALAALSWPAARPRRGRVSPTPPVRSTTVDISMAGLSVGLWGYVAVQLSAVALGEDHVLERSGLTYADWARSGFFQLVAVAAISAVVLLLARTTPPRATHPRRALPLTLGFAVASIVATSVVKLIVYADRFGLTMLRTYTVLFALWIGLASVSTAVACVVRGRRWSDAVVIGTFLLGSFSLNVANPETIVASTNLSRAIDQLDERDPDLDTEYLGRLSLDAAPSILARLDELADVDPKARERLEQRWCRPIAARGWRSTNVAVRNARVAFAEHCIDR